jgi:hypothetical protein
LEEDKMSTEVIDAPIARRGLRPHWATTTTTTFESDIQYVSVASEAARTPTVIYLEVPYARMKFDSLPPTVGKMVLVEGAIEQVGQLEDVLASSGLHPRFPIIGAWRTLSAERTRISPSQSYRDEMLDWDVSIEVAPKRPSGTIAVTLNYSGRGKPTAFNDPWD